MAQVIEADDGTTSVDILAGGLLGTAEKMLAKGMSPNEKFMINSTRFLLSMHPTIIDEAFKASPKAVEYIIESMSVDLKDQANLLRAASPSLNSKITRLRIFSAL